MEAFFPELYEETEFKSLKYLSEEVIYPYMMVNKRVLDIIAEGGFKAAKKVWGCFDRRKVYNNMSGLQ